MSCSRQGTRERARVQAPAALVRAPRRAALATVTSLAMLLSWSSSGYAQNAAWSSDRAATVPQGRTEFGLTSPSRFALTDEAELSTTLLLNFLLPHVELKLVWPQEGRWQLATRHRLTYPTWLFQAVSREGTGGLLPATTQVPQLLQLENEVILERDLDANHSVALHAGVAVAPRLSDGDPVLLELPFVYPRVAAASTWATFRAGARLRGQLGRHWGYSVGAEAFLLPAVAGGAAMEQELSIHWRLSRTWSLSAGYLMSYARYPYGERFHVMPLLDAIFALD